MVPSIKPAPRDNRNRRRPSQPLLGLDVVAEALLEYRDGHVMEAEPGVVALRERSRLLFPLLSVTPCARHGS